MSSSSFITNSLRRALFCLAVGTLTAGAIQAQCEACTSSMGCGDSNGRGGCTVHCQGTSCACGDNKCLHGAAAFRGGMATYTGPGDAKRAGNGKFLITDCQGNFYGVAYAPARAASIELALGGVALTRMSAGARYASMSPRKHPKSAKVLPASNEETALAERK